MDSPSRQSIIESPSLRKHRDMFSPRHRSSLPAFSMSSTTPLKSPGSQYIQQQQQHEKSVFYNPQDQDQDEHSDAGQGHHSPSPAGPSVFKVPTFLSRRAATASSQSASAVHRFQAVELEANLAKLLDDNDRAKTGTSQQAHFSTLQARKSLDSLRQSQRRSLDSAIAPPSSKPALHHRLRTTETEYDVSPSRSARLLSTPAASSFVGTPSRKIQQRDHSPVHMRRSSPQTGLSLGRQSNEGRRHVTPENLATLEWLERTAEASSTDVRDDTTEHLDQRYTRQTSVVEEEQGHGHQDSHANEHQMTAERYESSAHFQNNHNSSPSRREYSERVLDTYSEKENIPIYSDQRTPQDRLSTLPERYIDGALDTRTPDANHSVRDAESSLLEVAETTTTLTKELRGVYTKMQDFFSPETEAKLNGAICVIGSQKVNKVANGLPLSASKPRPLEFRSASVRKNYRTPSSMHSTKPLTTPVPFNFSERLSRIQRWHTPRLLQSPEHRTGIPARTSSGKHRGQDHVNERSTFGSARELVATPVRSRTVNEYQEMSKSPFIPLDQRKRLLAKHSAITHNEMKRPLTEPRSPVLLTRTRLKSQMNPQEEQATQESSLHKGYKASPLDRHIFESGGISGIPKIPKLPLTVPKSPAFTKRKPAPLRSAVMPSKPHTNYTQTQDSIKTKAGITQRGLVTSAESARRLSQERLKRSAHHDHVNTSRSKLGRSQLTKPALTVPEPFSFVTDARGERYQEQFRNKLVRWKQIEKEQQFKALPLPVYPELFIPKKSTKPLTHTEAIALQTDKRAEEREVYEQERRRKEELLQDMLAEKARDDELREQQELRELRKRLVPHPTPIREYPRIEIHKSTRLLTVPHSPNIGEKRKRQMTLERELSTYEDQYHSQAVPAPSNRQYSRTDLEQQLERELKRENERAQERDFERRRVSNSNARDHGEQQQRQNMVREEIERQRERDAYYRQVQQQQRQHVQRQSYSGEYQEFAQEGMQDGFEDGHEPAKRSRIFEEEEEDTPHVHMQSNFCRRMGRKSWLEANDL